MAVNVNMTWTIVKFIRDESVEAIPTIWIYDNNCRWPRYTSEKLQKAIKTCEPPLSSWEEHAISTFRNATYDNYVTARKKCRKAEHTSDLNSDLEAGRMIKPPTRLGSLSESSSDNSEIDITLVRRHTLATIPPCPSMSLTQSIPESALNKISDTGEPECNCCPEHKMVHNTNNELLKQIIRKMSMLELSMADIRTEIGNLNTPSMVVIEFGINIWAEFDIPLKSNEELQTFDDFLKMEPNMAKSVTELSKLGGDTVNEFIRRALQKLISNRLASEYSWVGLKKKKVFSKLNVVILLIAAAQRNPKTNQSTVSEIENAVKKFLRRSKERADAEERKFN